MSERNSEPWNCFECDHCDNEMLVTPENSRFLTFEKPEDIHYTTFIGDCESCDMTSYRFVPFAVLEHFEYIDWEEVWAEPNDVIKTEWQRAIGQGIDEQVGEFALRLEGVEPFDITHD